MCSFDIKSLSTNVPLDETIKICTQQLYHSDMEVSLTLTEKSFVTLIEKVTKGVEFSFDNIMYKQTDGVAMGSPLGPVLANIFVGFHEQHLNLDNRLELLLYKRYVDDTFSLHLAKEQSSKFFEELNDLHPAVKFSCEQEKDHKLRSWKFTCTSGHLEMKAGHRLRPLSTGSLHSPGYTPNGTRSQHGGARLTLSNAWQTVQYEYAQQTTCLQKFNN